MSRIVDEPYFTHSAYSAFTTGIQVKCPKCHGAGVVTADDDNAYSNLFHCDRDGVYLYIDMAMKQIAQAMEQNKSDP